MTASLCDACSPSVLQQQSLDEATRTFTHSADLVNFWKLDLDVEAARPSHCAACRAPAHRPDGRLRLVGHGIRTRTIWGPKTAHGEPELWEIKVRRYLCMGCRAARTVRPPGFFPGFRYSLSAIALALLCWALWLQPAPEARKRVSPFSRVGDSQPGRWRSLNRWSRRGQTLFGLPNICEARIRTLARRTVHLLLARAPPGPPQLERAFVGAQVR